MILDSSAARGLVARVLQEAEIAVLPMSDAHFGVAMEDRLRFGKERHPAALNVGDCLSFATAVVAEQPLLAVGDDFPRTDCPLA